MIKNEGTIKKLYKVFKDGYRPSRLKQTYCMWIKTNNREGFNPIDICNCVAHAFFNPTNEILKNYGFDSQDDIFGTFGANQGSAAVFSEILHFVKDVGLKVEECARDTTISNFKSWKVDAYFRYISTNPDYHFMLQESRGIYSHKWGFSGDVSVLCEAPEHYRNYDYCATYLITNIHADENNAYNKPLIEHTAITF